MRTLYLVTGWGKQSLEEFIRMVSAAVEGGVSIVQLREKEASQHELIARAKALKALLGPLGVPLIINDSADVAHAAQADGVHLGQTDGSVSQARLLLGRQAVIGLSVETLEQAKAAAEENVDYIAASPVLPTQTKADVAAPWGWDGLKQLCSLSLHPVIAIGGMNETNAAYACECGAAGVAVVSAICAAPCPKTAARRICDALLKRTRVH